MKVLKFGGSSVANANNIKQAAAIVCQQKSHAPVLVVVSALGGITDQLLQTGTMAAAGNAGYTEQLQTIEKRHLDTVRELLPVTNQSACLSIIKQHCNELEDMCNSVFQLQELSLRTRDRISSYGEMLSSKIFAAYLQSLCGEAIWLNAGGLINTDSNFGYAAVDFEKTNEQITEAISSHPGQLWVAPGFIASNSNGHTTTLGRGGSDYSAAIFAAALNADELEIWTDVSGMMTADPRWVSNAKPIPHISYAEAMELSHFGAKVLYPPTIEPVMKKNIPIWIKNTFAPEDNGTLVQKNQPNGNDLIRGISGINNIALLSLEGSGMVGIPGFSKKLFQSLALEMVNVILITQSSSEHSICVAVNDADASKAKHALQKAFEPEIQNGKIASIEVEKDQSVIALVGDKMKSHSGVAGKMFAALGKNGINIRAIAQGSSERNISVVVATNDLKKALNVLHEAFFEAAYKQLNVYIAGAGNVGKKLLEQIQQQQDYLLKHAHLQLRVAGIINSKKMLLNDEGIALQNWEELLAGGVESNLQGYAAEIIKRNLRNSVLVDVTASDSVPQLYEELLRKSIAVVACNKIAASSAYSNYKKLKTLSKEYNAPYLFETNVGAGLPVIGTLNDMVKSGDTIWQIDAVLSGTLNFVFNNYDTTIPFAQVVRQAQNEGYTEPDPRLDLGGTDVMRKIMILARETGATLEMNDIDNNGFLPASCFDGSVEDFYKEMEKHEAHFQALYKAAADKGCKLKFVASYKEGKAAVGLQHIDTTHDFFHLYGKDNIVLFKTARYPQQPLVVKGAGAGADVTASGVFADIMRAVAS